MKKGDKILHKFSFSVNEKLKNVESFKRVFLFGLKGMADENFILEKTYSKPLSAYGVPVEIYSNIPSKLGILKRYVNRFALLCLDRMFSDSEIGFRNYSKEECFEICKIKDAINVYFCCVAETAFISINEHPPIVVFNTYSGKKYDNIPFMFSSSEHQMQVCEDEDFVYGPLQVAQWADCASIYGDGEIMNEKDFKTLISSNLFFKEFFKNMADLEKNIPFNKTITT